MSATPSRRENPIGHSLPVDESSDKCIYVLSEIDGYKYKLVIKGDINRLTIKKLKEHLEHASGIPAQSQLLLLHTTPLTEKLQGIRYGVTLRLKSTAEGNNNVPSPHRYDAAEMSKSFEEKAPSPAARPINSDSTSTSASPSVYRNLFVDRRSTSQDGKWGDAGGLREGDSVPAGSRRSGSNGLSVERDASSPSGHRHHMLSFSTFQKCRNDRGENDALRRRLEAENDELRRLVVEWEGRCRAAQREAANAASDWKLEEEVERLRHQIEEEKRNATIMAKNLNAKWELKENDLIRELDRCREERRVLREQRSNYEREQSEYTRGMAAELRIRKQEVREKEEQIQHLRQEVARLQSQLNPEADEKVPSPRLVGTVGERRGGKCFDEIVNDAITALSHALGLVKPIELAPDNYTAVIEVAQAVDATPSSILEKEVSRVTLLVTVDPAEEQLFVYSTLMNWLPLQVEEEVRLYEMLLEGALLGRETAGGVLGVSREDHLVLLSTSVDLRRSDADAMASKVVPFVEAVRKWTLRLHQRFPPTVS